MTAAARTLACLVVLACLFLLRSLLALTDYTIYGTVRGPDGSPVRGALVEITGQTGTAMRTYTDDLGRYEVGGVLRGNYRIIASNPSDARQVMDPLEIDTSQFASVRILVNLFLRHAPRADNPRESAAGITSLGEEAEQAPKSAQNAFDKAIELRRKGKLDDAVKSVTKAIEIFPGYFRAITERGHLYIALQRPVDAHKDFVRALELNPRYGPALRGAGMCEFREGKFSDAIQTLTKAADAEPGNATNYLFMGIAYAALDRRDQAESALLKALSIDPVGAVRAHIYLADLWMKGGRPQDAIQELEAYLDAATKAPDADHFRKILEQLRARNPKH